MPIKMKQMVDPTMAHISNCILFCWNRKWKRPKKSRFVVFLRIFECIKMEYTKWVTDDARTEIGNMPTTTLTKGRKVYFVQLPIDFQFVTSIRLTMHVVVCAAVWLCDRIGSITTNFIASDLEYSVIWVLLAQEGLPNYMNRMPNKWWAKNSDDFIF